MNFGDIKFVSHKIAELLVFVGTNTVTYLLKKFAFSQSVLLIAVLTVSFIFIFLLFETQSEYHQHLTR